jgi:plastocyanin
MRGKYVIAALTAAAISGTAAADVAAQATATVNAGPGNVWTPNNPTVQAGGTVTFNSGASHNLYINGNEVAPVGMAFTRVYTAPAAPATVPFSCTIHGGMTGNINVVAAPAAPPPTPITPAAPGAPAPVTPATDAIAPRVTRVAASRNLRRAIVRFRLSEDAEVTARLRRRGSTRTLKRVTRELDAGNRTLTLRKRLAAGARYQVALRIEDAAGNVTTRTVSFTAPRS